MVIELAKCKRCGKSGLFLRTNSQGLCKDCAENDKLIKTDVKKYLYKTDASYRKATDELDHQDRLLKVALKARDQYKIDGDCDKAISEYEKVMIEATPPLKSNAHAMFLLDLYLKAGYNNKAWGYTNKLIQTHGLDIDKIRKYQAKILKKEEKHAEAIKMLMLHHLAKSKWNNTFNREAFIKDIMPSIKKLKWAPEDADTLADMVFAQVKAKDYKESALTSKYSEYVKAHG